MNYINLSIVLFIFINNALVVLTQSQNQSATLPLGKCTLMNCPLMQGVCAGEVCVCGNGFVTVNKITDGHYCNYKSKQRLIAFLLEFFFPFGVGHLYAENLLLAIIKFSLFALFLSLFCLELCCLQTKLGGCLVVVSFVFVVDIIIWIGFQMVDIIGYALGYYTDGYGVKMN